MICYYIIFSFSMIPFASIVMGYEDINLDVFNKWVSLIEYGSIFSVWVTKTYVSNVEVKDGCRLNIKGRDIEVYTTLISGHFSYAKSLSELRKNGIATAQNVSDMYILPINYPALYSDIVLFSYDVQDGKIATQTFIALNKSGPFIKIDLYNVKGSDIVDPASVNVSKLESLSRDDLDKEPLCQSYIKRTGETHFTAEYGNCDVEGFKLATYKATYSCDSLTFNVNLEKFPHNGNKLPYIMNKIQNYPVPDSIFQNYDKYKAMCGY